MPVGALIVHSLVMIVFCLSASRLRRGEPLGSTTRTPAISSPVRLDDRHRGGRAAMPVYPKGTAGREGGVRIAGGVGRRAGGAGGPERGAEPARSRRVSGALIHKSSIRQ